MRGLAYLSWRRLAHHRGTSAILICCLALVLFLPLVTNVLLATYDRELGARAAATPLVAGAKGNRFDLTLAALYFRAAELERFPLRETERLAAAGDVLAVPLHLRFTARGRPLVGTVPEYFERRGLRARQGALPLLLGECVLGAALARELGLAVGATLFSDPLESYGLASGMPVRLRVSGVLAPVRSPDDEAIFVDLTTARLLEGLLHGHAESAALQQERGDLVLGRTEGHVVFSPALIETAAVDDANVATFHQHGDPADLPVDAVLLFPRDAAAETLLKTRENRDGVLQVVRPAEVVRDLMAYVFRLKALADAIWSVLALTTGLLLGVVVLLSTRLRAAELDTLRRIGASRGVALRLLGLEFGLLLLGAALLAGTGTAVVAWSLPNLVHLF